MATANENMPPAVVQRVVKDVRKLLKTELEGIRLDINEDDVTDIRATIAGPKDTPYEGGFFRLKLILNSEFPTSPPKGYFTTTIFHPNVAKNGEICVSTLKKDWKPSLGLDHVLLTVKCLLIVPNPESALNEEAGKLLLEDYEEYCKRARLMTDIYAKPKDAKSAGAGDGAVENIGAYAPEKLKKKVTKTKSKALKRL
ncbi:ubiquitin-conjugating enzyme E2 S-B [Sphaeroforma arctica JP610]|uniref:E2 ubiquitin-conjugating enzyme n=1 Tax=Sphaeroforma arctica JP610 TaxID=667725 RepID=A0A0L0G0V9_9EUKA|nr:ubiquitin-conjugating enzyme E2 S-B [Sphaeroforma arctica JP610]KNC82466.1 ubiquitin-conjugating enzyme E2 S-B [Sphaeroforma arctica JP610]|eukprot:XP_014156368.1 ubiquitin-conjugating enzyme E2 S-B [Sphaeroforma arctica JP610]